MKQSRFSIISPSICDLSVEYPTPCEHRLIDSLAVQVIGIEKASFTYGYIRDQDERAKVDTAWQHVCTEKIHRT
jgi:hypothetical protein